MKDLIFRPPGSERDETLSAKASLEYVEPTKEDGDTDEEEGESPQRKSRLSKKLPQGKKTIFSRIVTTKGTGEYQINGKSVTFKQYEKKLASIGVLLKARNFLVFQGDVESMARKNPKELVEMFENLSGSADLKEEYELALKAKDEAEQKTIFAYNKTKEHKSERRVLKEQKVRIVLFGDLMLLSWYHELSTQLALIIFHPINRRKRSVFMTYSNSVPPSKKTISYGSSFTFTQTFSSVSPIKQNCKNPLKSVKK